MSADNLPVDSQSIRSVVEQLSPEEIKQLVQESTPATEAKLQELVNSLPKIQEKDKEKEMGIARCRSIAEFTLLKENEYLELKKNLYDSYQEALEEKKEIEKKKEKLDEHGRQTSLDITLALLQTATAEAEEEAENLASSLFSSEMRVDDFLKQFIDKRKLAHLRRIKTEKLMELVRNQANGASNLQPVRTAPVPPVSSPTNSPPYPISSTNHENMPENPQFPFSSRTRPMF